MRRWIVGWLAAGVMAVTGTSNAASLGYAVAVLDLGAPNVFGIAFAAPIAPLTGLASYSFAGNIVLADGTVPPDGVSATPTLPEFWRLEIGDGLGGFTVIDQVGGTSTLIGPGTFNFSAAGLFDCSALSGGCAWLKLTFGFGLSGGSDTLSSSGVFALLPASVPEPTTLALLGIGLAGLALRRRKQSVAHGVA